MKKHSIILSVLFVVVFLLISGASFAAQDKPQPPKKPLQGQQLLVPPSPKSVSYPDLDKDPGFFFMLAEQAEMAGDTEGVVRNLKKAIQLDPDSSYLYTRVGNLLARNRRIADSLIMTQIAALLDAQNDESLTLLGKIFTVTGDRHKAIEAYSRALELKPDERELYVFIGSLQASQKMFADAEKTFTKMISQFPDEKEGYFYLGRVYVEDKKFDKGIETFKSLLDKGVDGAAQIHLELGGIHLLLKNYSEAESQFREAIKQDPTNVSARLNLGQALASQKKYKESYEVFEELSKLAPSNLGIQIKMALILAEQKQFDSAKEILDKILSTKPGWDQVRFQLGRVLKEQGKLDESEKEFVQIRKGQPTFLHSRIILALMFLKVKDFGKALKYIDEAVDSEAKDADLFHIRGSILEELNRYNEALVMYDKALEQDPTNIRIRYSKGNVLEKSGRRVQAMVEMEKILAEKPDDPSALNFVGYTLAISGKDASRAERLVRKAMELKPDDGYVMDSLGWLLFKTGKTDEALAMLEKAYEKVKTDPIIAEHLGDLLVEKNRRSEALEAYRKSLEVNPENLVVQGKLKKLESEIGSEKK